MWCKQSTNCLLGYRYTKKSVYGVVGTIYNDGGRVWVWVLHERNAKRNVLLKPGYIPPICVFLAACIQIASNAAPNLILMQRKPPNSMNAAGHGVTERCSKCRAMAPRSFDPRMLNALLICIRRVCCCVGIVCVVKRTKDD